MEFENERLRNENRELQAELARLRERNAAHMRRPEGGQRTSAADADLLFTAAE